MSFLLSLSLSLSLFLSLSLSPFGRGGLSAAEGEGAQTLVSPEKRIASQSTCSFGAARKYKKWASGVRR